MTVARVTKITAASPTGFQDAVEQALSRAAQTLRGISGLEVISQKAKVEDGKISEYRATIEVTLILEGYGHRALLPRRRDRRRGRERPPPIGWRSRHLAVCDGWMSRAG